MKTLIWVTTIYALANPQHDFTYRELSGDAPGVTLPETEVFTPYLDQPSCERAAAFYAAWWGYSGQAYSMRCKQIEVDDATGIKFSRWPDDPEWNEMPPAPNLMQRFFNWLSR